MKINKLLTILMAAKKSSADVTVPNYSSGEIGAVDASTVAITFSEAITGSNYAAGVTIKKNTVSQTVTSASRQIDTKVVYYVLNDLVTSTDTITWEYVGATGNITDIATNALGNVNAQTVTNNAHAPVSGNVTFANIILSSINGTAFVDFSAVGALTNYLGGKLTITDHAGHKLIGYIKAAGTGETYGTERLANTTLENTTGVSSSIGTLSSVAGGQVGNCLQVANTGNAASTAYETPAVTNGWAVKAQAYLKKGTSTEAGLMIQQNDGDYLVYTAKYNTAASWVLNSIYFCADVTSYLFKFLVDWEDTAGLTALFDEASCKQVLTPATTGVTIVSALGGSTYNWTSEESGFNRNDTGNYTYSIQPFFLT
jgi:hypothetical protein